MKLGDNSKSYSHRLLIMCTIRNICSSGPNTSRPNTEHRIDFIITIFFK